MKRAVKYSSGMNLLGNTRLVSVLIAVLTLVTCSLPAIAETTLTVAIRWGAASGAGGIYAAAEEFEKLHPGVRIEFLHSAAWSDRVDDGLSSKLMTLVVSGLSPDIAMVGGHVVPQYAHLGLLMPIDRYITDSGLQKEDFIPAAWDQTQWLGKQYAMTLQVDPNFAFVWNKDLFGEAGLPKNQPPVTLRQYEEYFKKLTQMGNEGVLNQVGGVPWEVYGNYNTAFTWGWIFNGSFYDYETNRVTANDPAIVESFEFLRDYYERYHAILPAVPADQRLVTGKAAMSFEVSTTFKNMRARLGDDSIGAGLMPYKDGGTPNPSWIGGWAMGILPDTPHPDLAWEFVRFVTATPEGTDAFGRTSGAVPAYLKSPVHEAYLDDPVMSVYLEIAQSARNRRPGMPVVADYASEIGNALTDVLTGKKQPQDALELVNSTIQKKLDEAMSDNVQ